MPSEGAQPLPGVCWAPAWPQADPVRLPPTRTPSLSHQHGPAWRWLGPILTAACGWTSWLGFGPASMTGHLRSWLELAQSLVCPACLPGHLTLFLWISSVSSASINLLLYRAHGLHPDAATCYFLFLREAYSFKTSDIAKC